MLSLTFLLRLTDSHSSHHCIECDYAQQSAVLEEQISKLLETIELSRGAGAWNVLAQQGKLRIFLTAEGFAEQPLGGWD